MGVGGGGEGGRGVSLAPASARRRWVRGVPPPRPAPPGPLPGRCVEPGFASECDRAPSAARPERGGGRRGAERNVSCARRGGRERAARAREAHAARSREKRAARSRETRRRRRAAVAGDAAPTAVGDAFPARCGGRGRCGARRTPETRRSGRGKRAASGAVAGDPLHGRAADWNSGWTRETLHAAGAGSRFLAELPRAVGCAAR